jgi:DNA-binding NarL/FixJ family response regulator
MRMRGVVALVAGATLMANLLLGVTWALAVGAGIAVFVVGEVTGRVLATRPVTVPVSPLGGGHPLSRREVEVAVLIAQGLTSKEVGRKLFIERGTVDTHVQHIYNKLQIESRPQLAVWLVDHGLLDRSSPQK